MTEQQTSQFPDNYYMTQDPLERKAILEKALASAEDKEINQARMELFNRRYETVKKSDQLADVFLRFFIDLKYAASSMGTIFGKKGVEKDIRKSIEQLGFLEAEQKGLLYQELLYQECYHASMLYMNICMTDRNYTTSLLGIVSIKDSKVKEKIAKDMAAIVYKVPDSLSLTQELRILIKAAKTAYADKFPQGLALEQFR